MADRRPRAGLATIAGAAAGLVAMAGLWLAPLSWRETLRQQGFDLMLSAAAPWRAPPAPIRVAIVDIDGASLAAIGPWPWRRETIAQLIAATHAAAPAAIGVDILLAGVDLRSPAALARQLRAATGRDDLGALAQTLPDGDKALVEALADAPVALGFVLDPRGGSDIPELPILTRDEARFGRLWSQDGATGPPAEIANAAAGAGTLSLPGDADGIVRRVPLLVAVAGTARPGLALETLRLAAGASGYLLSGRPASLGFGERRIAMPDDGFLRLLPPDAAVPIPVVPAGDVLGGKVPAATLAGAIVIIGGSAPELGALRPSLRDPLTASATLQAEAVRQIAAGVVPIRPAAAGALEQTAALVAILAAIAFARRLRPSHALVAIALGLAGLCAGATAMAAADRLLDPLAALAAAAMAFLVTSLVSFSETRLREARLRRRFEQHLAPGVVERIVANPSSLKLTGERRQITALFTDIEGFTHTTRSVEPEQLVGALDGYFEGVTRIIGAHGGMVDKFVGDAVHAFFNAPLDLPDHPRIAVACAVEVLAWTETYRHQGLAAAIRLGRTRLGIETGEAIVGDVGVGAKLDYTAHGDAVNTAARLEALNKELGSSICIGPVAASFCAPGQVEPLAQVELRGIGPVAVFTVRD